MSASPDVSRHADRPGPVLSAVVVHWRNEAELAHLLASWPRDPQFPIVVVDNSGTAEVPPERDGVRGLRPSANLGFGGGCNAGVRATSSPWVLLLNPDASIDEGQLRSLAELAGSWGDDPRLAFIAPRLVDGEGKANQFTWQLKPVPRRRDLLAQCFFLARPKGPAIEPDDGARVAQPAAAALLIRRSAFDEIDGFDTRFAPAWFEDVDLAQRLADAGWHGRYARSVQVRHDGGASVSPLGFGRFLVIYTRNLRRYAEARGWSWTARAIRPAVALAAALRLPFVLIRRPKATRTRREAVRSMATLLGAALRGWPETPA